ncbi:MAG: ABC transporter permease [bacterium]|nr:ABC transporter permease [bacterium]MDE0417352.1 ABC transporter permease [bacterium]
MPSVKTGYVILLGSIFVVFFVMPVGFFLSVSVALYLEPGIFDDTFTLENYARLVRDDYALGVLTDTLRISAYVTVLCLVLGYPLAMFIARETGFVRRAVMIVTVASLFTNLVVRTYGWLVFLTPRGLFNNMLLDAGLIEKPLRLMFNETGVIVGLVQIMLPIQIIVLAVSLQAIDRVLEDAASIAGAGKVRIFTRIIWPLSLPGVISGSILVFTLSMSSFITPEFLGGGRVMVLGTLIRQLMTRSLNYPFAAAVSATLLLLAIAMLVSLAIISRRVMRHRAS